MNEHDAIRGVKISRGERDERDEGKRDVREGEKRGRAHPQPYG